MRGGQLVGSTLIDDVGEKRARARRVAVVAVVCVIARGLAHEVEAQARGGGRCVNDDGSPASSLFIYIYISPGLSIPFPDPCSRRARYEPIGPVVAIESLPEIINFSSGFDTDSPYVCGPRALRGCPVCVAQRVYACV